jgi:hypothetical protein
MFQGIEFWKAVLIFIGYFGLDILSSWFIIALNRLQRGTTTILTFLLYIGSGAGIYQYTHHFSYLVFAALGACLGNYVLLTIEINRQKNKSK